MEIDRYTEEDINEDFIKKNGIYIVFRHVEVKCIGVGVKLLKCGLTQTSCWFNSQWIVCINFVFLKLHCVYRLQRFTVDIIADKFLWFRFVWCIDYITDDTCMCHATPHISRILDNNEIADHSDVSRASPVRANPITSSFSIWHLAAMDWAETTTRRDEKHLSFGTNEPHIWFGGNNFHKCMCPQTRKKLMLVRR